MPIRVVIWLFAFVSTATAQVNRYVVYFKDKAGNGYSITQPEKFLSEASLNRRETQQIAIVDDDLPVTQNYVRQVHALGAKTFFTSRWLNCLLIEATDPTVQVILKLPEVNKVEYVAPGNRLQGGRVSAKFNATRSKAQQTSYLQYQQVGIDQMNLLGYTGRGVHVAVFDGGFLGVNTTTAFQQTAAKLKSTYNFVDNSDNVFLYNDHGTEVFSLLAAQTPAFSGGIVDAEYYLFLTEDVSSEYRIEEYNWVFAAERADSLGVDVISSSLGYNLFGDPAMNYKPTDLTGNKAIVSIGASKALAKGIMVVTSAGNEGASSWRYINPPADVAGILSVGSITAQQILSPFSSVGPTADGRIKPDVVAMGSATSLINSSGNVVSGSGTSFSCPLITCLYAGLRQAFPRLSVHDIYNAITKTADQANTPNNYKGYGLPNFTAVVNYLEQMVLNEPIVISPNPVTTSMKVLFREITELEEVNMTIFSLMGQKMVTANWNLNWKNNPIEFDLSSLAAGVYIVQLKSASQSLTLRIIKL